MPLNITRGKVSRAQKVVIYAPEGFGKSTLASLFPDPLFLDLEGSTAQLDVARIDRDALPNLAAFERTLGEVAKEKPCGSLVIDTVDWLDDMAAEAIIAEAANPKIKGIEDFGYGKGYIALKERMTVILGNLDRVISAGIHVVLLAHSKVAKFEPPDGVGAFDRYTLKLSKHVEPLVKEWADAVLFGNYRTQISESDSGKLKGVGGRERMLYATRCSAWDAKNRHGMPDSQPWSIEAVKKAFAHVGAPWDKFSGSVVHLPSPVAASAAPVAASNTPAEPMPAIDPDPLPGAGSNPDIVRIVGELGEEAVNSYLIATGKVAPGKTWLDMEQAFVDRILRNPAGFAAAVRKEAK